MKAWAIVDERGEILGHDKALAVYSTKETAESLDPLIYLGERVVPVEIRILEQHGPGDSRGHVKFSVPKT